MIRVSFSSLKDGRWYEYVLRFVLGGATTVMTGLIGAQWGPGIGGLFLAFPAMLCASATLVQSHEIRRKGEAGLRGVQRGRDAAALDAAGAALGSVGLVAFAATLLLFAKVAPWAALAVASLLWAVTAIFSWWIHQRSRRAHFWHVARRSDDSNRERSH